MLCQRLALRSIPNYYLKFAIVKPQSQYSSSARGSTETHYEVLKLRNSCSPKQIREAFIKLSKESHPDKNKDDPSTHKRFIRINEAYNTLIKPDSRREYDYILSQQTRVRVNQARTVYQARDHVQEDPIFHKPFRDHSFYENRDRSQDAYYKSKPFYGVPGIKKLSNSTIVWVLIVFTIFGVGLQALAIESARISRDQLNQRSKDNGDTLKEVKRRAEEYGSRDRQIEELRKRTES